MINLTKDIKKAKEVAKILYYKFNSEDGIFGHNIMPEDLKPKAIKWGSNISNTSKYEYLMFITMVVSIDYQRDANKLWEAGRKTFDDETTKWLFDPKICNSKKFQDIREAMSKYKLSKKPNQDPCIWNSVSYSFFKLYDSDPKNLVRECDFDAVRIYEKINANKNSFPFLSGDKILQYYSGWGKGKRDEEKIEKQKRLC